MGISGGWHPWRALRRRPEVTLLFGDPGPNAWGRTDYDTKTITLAPDLLQVERRCTLTHELVHLERGPAPVGGEEREERLVDATAARLLIPSVRALGEALAWAHHPEEAADELWVDIPTLMTRLRHLHPAERAYLRRRLACATS